MPAFDSNDDSDIEGGNLIQIFLLVDKPQKEKTAVAVGEKDTVTAGEKTAINKVRFLEDLSKLFPEVMRFLIIKKLMTIVLK